MCPNVHKTGRGNQLGILFPAILENLPGVLRKVEGFFRNLGIGDAALPVVVAVYPLRAEGRLPGFESQAVGDRRILIDPAQGIPDIRKQLRPVKLVPGRRIQMVPGKDPPGQLHAGNRLLFLRAKPRSHFDRFLAHIPASGTDQLYIAAAGTGKQLFITVRRNPVVTVHKAQPLSPGNVDPRITGTAQAAVFLVDHPDPGIPGRIFVADGAAAVRGAIVHQDQLKVRDRLGKNGIHAPGKIAFHLINRYDNAE